MSTVEVSTTTRTRKPRTRNGEASVITDELLEDLAEAIRTMEDKETGLVVLDSHPRATPGSAAGFGYQIREKLARAPYNLKVHSSPVPVDEEAWEALPDAARKQPKNATDAQKDAVKHFAAFYPYKD